MTSQAEPFTLEQSEPGREVAPRSVRSRHGCNTCKVRRVKCDESKPGCMRCTKFGRTCDGYTIKKISPARRTKSAPRPRPLTCISLVPRIISCPPRSPSNVPFCDQDEARYFRSFCEETPRALSGDYDSPLWNRIVLQACHDEPCILHCAVAISALHQACRVRGIKCSGSTSENHHQYALQQYSKALKCLGDVICRPQDSLRTTLIASLLIFCFENFHGDFRLALTNIRTAVDLMHSWLTRNMTPMPRKAFSPRPHIIEDELVAALARLDVHLTAWIDEGHNKRTSILSYATKEPTFIPFAFTSILEAKTCFDRVTSRISGYLASVRIMKNEVDVFRYNRICDANGQPLVESAEAIELRDWMTAFDPFFKSARGNEIVAAQTLRIYALTLQVSLRCAFFPSSLNNNQYSIFLPEHCEIVALARKVSSHPSFARSFVFDSFIVPCLFIVAAKCSDIMLRREAINVLRKAGPRREGLWDALMVAKIGEELLRVESHGVGTNENEWVEIHMQCIGMAFMLPAPEADIGESPEERAVRLESGKYLLAWVERTMDMDIVSVEPRYRGRSALP